MSTMDLYVSKVSPGDSNDHSGLLTTELTGDQDLTSSYSGKSEVRW